MVTAFRPPHYNSTARDMAHIIWPGCKSSHLLSLFLSLLDHVRIKSASFAPCWCNIVVLNPQTHLHVLFTADTRYCLVELAAHTSDSLRIHDAGLRRNMLVPLFYGLSYSLAHSGSLRCTGMRADLRFPVFFRRLGRAEFHREWHRNGH